MEHLRSSDAGNSATKKGGILNTAFFSSAIFVNTLISIGFFTVAAFRVNAAPTGVYFTLDSFAYSESKSIKSFIDNNWNVDLQPGDVSFTVDRAEAGITLGRWQLGVIKRYDYYFEYSPETAAGIYQVKNKYPLNPGMQYDLLLSANTIVSDGLRVTYGRKSNSAVSYAVSLSYLRGERFTDGALQGQALALSDKDYDFGFDLDYHYSEDKLFDRVVNPPHGHGYAVDLVFDWQLTQQIMLGFQGYDILAGMYWDDAPRTVATATSDTKEYDKDGYLIYKPVISGIETNEDYVQRLPRRIFLSAAYSLNQYDLELAYRDYEIKSFYYLGARKKLNENSVIGLSLNLTARAFGIDYTNNWFRVVFLTDDLQIQEALTLEISLSARYLF